MTDDRTLERAARSWLEEGPTTAPDRAIDAALSRIETTRQERDLRVPWRNPIMNRYLLPIAAALIVVIGGVYLLTRPSSIIGPQASATPATPTPAPPSIVGTWETQFTSQDMLDAGVIGHVATDPDDYGHFRLTFTADQWQLSHLSPVPWVATPEPYSVDPGVLHVGQPGDSTYNARYTVTETTLTFEPQAQISLMVKPWTRVTPEPLAASVPGASELLSGDVGRSLTAGIYRPRGFAVELAITLPPGGWKMTSLSLGGVGFESPAVLNSNVALFVIDGVYPDPCHPQPEPEPINPGADGVVAALSGLRDFAVTEVADVTVGGLRGKAFRFGNSIDTAAAGCAANPLPFATVDQDGEGTIVDVEMFGGETDRFWALDSGGTTIVIAVTDAPAIVADAQPVIDTLIFGDGSGR